MALTIIATCMCVLTVAVLVLTTVGVMALSSLMVTLDNQKKTQKTHNMW